MIKIFIITLFVSLLYASNPTIYAALGDLIYNNVHKIEKLQDLSEYKQYHEQIRSYVKSVDRAKEMAFAIERGDVVGKEKEYLQSLRALSKENDYFLRSAELNYKKALEEQNPQLFIGIVNSGLIDTQKRKDEILDFYFEHQNDINASGAIQIFLEEDAQLKKIRDLKKAQYKSAKTKEEERIRRLREKDMRAQKELEQKLEEEVKKKKQQIRENQKSELKL